jgi:hypothetical protein
MHTRLLCTLLLLAAAGAPAAAQTVLFDGVTTEQGKASALLVPAIVTGNDYSVAARLNFGVLDRVEFFGQGGGTFNGGATAFAGLGWAATFVQQTKAFPLNFGFFNSYNFPIRTGGPDAFVTVAPVFSHSFERSAGGRVTPYAGAAVTFKVGGPGTGVNGLFGIRVAEIAPRWDFIAEVQPGENTQLAVGFTFRF